MRNDLLARILAFLAAHTTLTLATVAEDGQPQAAALFYAHDRAADGRLALYFLSEPSSRHCANLARQPRCAATIQADGQDWQEIQGLQIEGEAELVRGRELARAARVYTAKFSFLGELLHGGEGPAALAGLVARCRFYKLTPRWIRLIDNRQGIGYKEEWRRFDGAEGSEGSEGVEGTSSDPLDPSDS